MFIQNGLPYQTLEKAKLAQDINKYDIIQTVHIIQYMCLNRDFIDSNNKACLGRRERGSGYDTEALFCILVVVLSTLPVPLTHPGILT